MLNDRMGDSDINSDVDDKRIKRMMVKLNTKQKRSVKRQVEIEQKIDTPRHIVFKSKKIYTRKIKHKK
jgi:hypothetical protein|tara:strand:+ start:771 stop:974 length:204 start_codon:yes stop_codon:yes gene_type:complete